MATRLHADVPAAIAVVVISAVVAACGAPESQQHAPDTDTGDSRVTAPSDAALADDADAVTMDSSAADAELDAGSSSACSVSGAPGDCMLVSACAALADHTSFAGHCPGPADIECCITTPDTADNPPIPTGYELMSQSQVTPEMTAWAVAILNDPTTYPMFATTTMTFGTLAVLARVEWHPPDFQNSTVHRGVTLYEPL